MKAPPAAKALEKKFAARTARVGVVGLGYVGLPLAVLLARAGFRVTGIEIQKSKLRTLGRGRSYLEDLPDAELQEAAVGGRFVATDDYRALRGADAVSITVPTPLRKTKEPDVSYIQQAVESLIKVLPKNKGVLVVLESTTYPGTTRELVEQRFADAGFAPGRSLFVAFSPERVDPGNLVWKTHNTPKVVGGTSPVATALAASLYGQAIDEVVTVASSEEAEMVKLLENTFRAVNIALVNELALMCDRMGIDIWNVIEAAGTKPFGFMPFFPGPGIGGHCIPLDPMYLAWRAKAYDYTNRFIELATDINGNMPRFVLSKAARVLNRHQGKALKGAKILLLGIAYKAGVSDIRESPALEVLRLLEQEGARVSYADPHVSELQAETAGRRMRARPTTAATLRDCDLAVLLTAHPEFDYKALVRHAPLILDTRNAFAGVKSKKIVRL